MSPIFNTKFSLLFLCGSTSSHDCCMLNKIHDIIDKAFSLDSPGNIFVLWNFNVQRVRRLNNSNATDITCIQPFFIREIFLGKAFGSYRKGNNRLAQNQVNMAGAVERTNWVSNFLSGFNFDFMQACIVMKITFSFNPLCTQRHVSVLQIYS